MTQLTSFKQDLQQLNICEAIPGPSFEIEKKFEQTPVKTILVSIPKLILIKTRVYQARDIGTFHKSSMFTCGDGITLVSGKKFGSV